MVQIYGTYQEVLQNPNNTVFWGITPDGLAGAAMALLAVAGSIGAIYIGKSNDVRHRKKLTRGILRSAIVNLKLDLDIALTGLQHLISESKNYAITSYTSPSIPTANVDMIVSQTFDNLYLAFNPKGNAEKIKVISEFWRDLLSFNRLGVDLTNLIRETILKNNELGARLRTYLDDSIQNINNIDTEIMSIDETLVDKEFSDNRKLFSQNLAQLRNSYMDVFENDPNKNYITTLEKLIFPTYELVKHYNFHGIENYTKLIYDLNRIDQHYATIKDFKDITTKNFEGYSTLITALQKSATKFESTFYKELK